MPEHDNVACSYIAEKLNFFFKKIFTAEHRSDKISVHSNFERIVDDRDAFHMSVTHEQEAERPHRSREKPV